MMQPFVRPPKPLPLGGSGRANKETSLVDTSQASRESLRRDVARRRSSLTCQELDFLARLCIHGEEIELQLAQERLRDTDLFFDLKDDGGGWDSDTFRVGREVSISSAPEAVAECHIRAPSFTSSSSSSSAEKLGSQKRQEVLEERKKSILFGKLWQAHANGLAVSKQGSRRSLVRRSSASDSPASSYATRRLENIFRSHQSMMMDDIKSDNYRPASLANGQQGQGPNRRSSFQLQRRGSGSSRKSVTFTEPPNLRNLNRNSLGAFGFSPANDRKLAGELESDFPLSSMPLPLEGPTRASSLTVLPSFQQQQRQSLGSELQRFIPSIHLAHPVRSDSLSSIPSIHQAHSVRSNSITSIPSIHLARPLRSQSFNSSRVSENGFSASHPFDEVRDPVDEDEKKSDTSSLPSKVEFPDSKLHDDTYFTKPVVMRDASENWYKGEGIEVSDWETPLPNSQQHGDPVATLRGLGSLVSFGEASATGNTIRLSHSFDESMSPSRVAQIFRRSIPRSLSDDDMAGILLGGAFLIMRDGVPGSAKERYDANEDASWNMDDDDTMDYYDPWKVIEDEYDNGYGGGGTFPFNILGTSADDEDAHPHVLSPPLMESLHNFLPTSKSSENFWMKYSMVRDGASPHTFLKQARGSKYSFLAIETVDGEVFGAFTSEPWRKNWNYFGSGESFLWRMRLSRKEKSLSIIDQAQKESEIDVFPFTGENDCIQLCTHDMIAVGGGTGDVSPVDESSAVKGHHWGFGLTIESDFLHGTTSPCLTFGSPSLSNVHSDGSLFEIINIELWTLTPCMRLEDAEKLELSSLFLERHRRE